MKIKLILPIAVLALSAFSIQASGSLTTTQAKAYNAQLEKIQKTLTEVANVIEKPNINTKKLQKTIKKLRDQEKTLMAYNEKSVKDASIIEVRDPNLDPDDDPIDYLFLGRLPQMLEYIVSNDYPPGASKMYVIGSVNSEKETVALKQKELKYAYDL